MKAPCLTRRQWVRAAGTSGLAVVASGALESPRARAAETARGGGLTITGLETILTRPATANLIVVKVLTSQPGLYGLGCATFNQRARVVETAVNEYLRPFLIGKNPLAIEDIWRSSYVSSYWRNGPVLNNALSGVDMALWDILGKASGMPVYQLLGGKCRHKVEAYRHLSASSPDELVDQARKAAAEGYRHVRVQPGGEGFLTYGSRPADEQQPVPANRQTEWMEPDLYCRRVRQMFAHLREKLGDDVELLHDVHERIPPILAIKLLKDLEQFRPFFIEDPFSPEDIGYFAHVRQQTATPLAMGELFNSPHEWLSLVTNRQIDFIRVHLSQMGGLTPVRKLAAVCEMFSVRTAWHGPGDLSPVGHAANAHLDFAVPNFGIQEARHFTQQELDVFPGTLPPLDGCVQINDRPGWGIELDEKLAARFPIAADPPFDMRWGNVRLRDGTIQKP